MPHASLPSAPPAAAFCKRPVDDVAPEQRPQPASPVDSVAHRRLDLAAPQAKLPQPRPPQKGPVVRMAPGDQALRDRTLLATVDITRTWAALVDTKRPPRERLSALRAFAQRYGQTRRTLRDFVFPSHLAQAPLLQLCASLSKDCSSENFRATMALFPPLMMLVEQVAEEFFLADPHGMANSVDPLLGRASDELAAALCRIDRASQQLPDSGGKLQMLEGVLCMLASTGFRLHQKASGTADLEFFAALSGPLVPEAVDYLRKLFLPPALDPAHHPEGRLPKVFRLQQRLDLLSVEMLVPLLARREGLPVHYVSASGSRGGVDQLLRRSRDAARTKGCEAFADALTEVMDRSEEAGRLARLQGYEAAKVTSR